MLCGHEAVKEALVDQAEEFSGRGEQATFDWLFKGYGEGHAGGGMWTSRLDGLSVPAFFSQLTTHSGLRQSPSSVSSVPFCLSLCPL